MSNFFNSKVDFYTYPTLMRKELLIQKKQKSIMKQIGNYILMLFVAIALTTTACSKDDDSSDGGFTPGETMMTAKIDGGNFVATGTESFKGEVEGSIVVMLGGEDDAERQFFITIHNFSGTGTYTVKEDGDNSPFADVLYWEQELEEGWWGMDGGKVIVTDYLPNERIRGTFQVELNNLNDSRRSVTDGKFEMAIVVEGD